MVPATTTNESRPASALPFSRGRSRAYLALTVIGFLVVGASLTEAFLQLRWVPPSALTTQAFGGHPLYVRAPLPGVKGEQACDEYRTPFEHNLLGFRGPLPDLSSDTDNQRLLVVGDSQTYGLGCGEGQTFADELRRELAGVEVLNTGCNGYGTHDALAIVHHLGQAWRPDVVLLVFFWNDVEDNVKQLTPSFELDAQGRVRRTDSFDESFDPLQLQLAIDAQPMGVSGLLLPRFFKEGLRGMRYRFLGIRKRSIRSEADRVEPWRKTRELLGLLAKRCAELECQLVIASLPDHNQVDPTAVIKNIDPVNYEVQEQLRAICEELEVPLIDLLPALRQQFTRTGRSLYYYADRHLKPEGHGIVGRQLATELRPYFSR